MSELKIKLLDALEDPLKFLMKNAVDIENLPGMRFEDRVPIMDCNIDPMDLFVLPPAFLSYTLDCDRDLQGEISNAIERYTPSQEVKAYIASLLFGQASPNVSYIDIDDDTEWINIQSEMQQISDYVHAGNHWAEEDEYSRNILVAPSLSCPVEYIHLTKSRTLKLDEKLSDGDVKMIDTLHDIQGEFKNTVFFKHLYPTSTSDTTSYETDSFLPDDPNLSSDETNPRDYENEFDNIIAQRDSNNQDSMNTWKSLSKTFVPEEFEAIRSSLIIKWSFELDNFQKQAIVELEMGNSVFVAAHTSAGKTVVAEYAIALSRHHGTRCIYCSPIKALSNQKYREFKEKFDEVGLVTGDIQLRNDAFFVIMTTEILRAMVYNSSEMIHELEWLIFDEVHYINDLERGVVWEEILILIPPHVKFVMLSATVPNAIEFADWVGHTKRRQVRVISTLERPVALQHYLYLPSGDMFLLRSGEGEFIPKGYKDALTCYHDRYRVRSANKRRNIWLSFIQHMNGFQLMPLIIFVFSRNLCDEMANIFGSQNLLSAEERVKVNNFMNRAMKLIDEEDRSLEQVMFVTQLSENGIGVHHSGLLPILKEYVEMLFTNGLIKVLVATETFAMGVNMPARSVVFISIRKFDGVSRRNLHAGEYTQMSGRAGRRGIDTSGMAIILSEGLPPPASDLSTMIQGSPSILLSKFRLTFAICLKILRTTGFSMLKMLRNSFSEFSGAKQALLAAHDYEETERRIAKEKSPIITDGPCSLCGSTVDEYVKDCTSYWLNKQKLDPFLLKAFYNCRYNQPGRLIFVQPNHNSSMVPAILVDCIHPVHKFVHVVVQSKFWTINDEVALIHGRPYPPRGAHQFSQVYSAQGDDNYSSAVSLEEVSWLPGFNNTNNIFVYPLRLPDDTNTLNIKSSNQSILNCVDVVFAKIPIIRVQAFSKLTMKLEYRMNEYHDPYMNRSIWKKMHDGSIVRIPSDCELFAHKCSTFLRRPEISQRSKNMFLDPSKDIGLRDYQSCTEEAELRSIFSKATQSECIKCPDILNHFNRGLRIWCCEERMDQLRTDMSDERLELLGEYKRRLKFLEQLGYLERNNRISLTCKGHAACLVNEKEIVLVELLCSKMILRSCQRNQPNSHNGMIPDPLGPHPIASLAAILSTLVCTARNRNDSESPANELESDAQPAMNEYNNIIKEIDEKLLAHDLGEYRIFSTLNMSLCQLVYRWTMGDSFKSCMELTEQQEGIVVKCIQRINDVCKEMQKAARYLTSLEMVHRLDQLRRKIQRGVVFTNSLYSDGN